MLYGVLENERYSIFQLKSTLRLPSISRRLLWLSSTFTQAYTIRYTLYHFQCGREEGYNIVSGLRRKPPHHHNVTVLIRTVHSECKILYNMSLNYPVIIASLRWYMNILCCERRGKGGGDLASYQSIECPYKQT